MTYLPRRRRNQPSRFSSFDPDASAYFTAAGITDSTEQEAWNTFVVGARAAGIWDKAYRVYPVSPTSIDAAAYCAKSLNQGSFVNSPTHSSNGVQFDGATQYFDTLESISSYMADTSSNSYGLYNRSSMFILATQYLFGADDVGDALIYYNNVPRLIARNHQANNNLMFSRSNPIEDRWVLATRTSSSDCRLFLSSTQVDDYTTDISPAIPGVIPVYGARRTPLSVDGFCAYEWAFGWIGSGLTPTESVALFNLVQAYQTALGRQLNV